MKKVLLATTAVIATAGVAAADVSFGGLARFGLFYDDSNTVRETRIEHRFRLNIDVSATSDAGVEFSARIRAQSDDNADGTSNTAEINGPRFTVEAGGLRLDVGNTGGAIDNMPNYYGYEPGLTAFVGHASGNSFGFDGYSSGDNAGGQTIAIGYSSGALSAMAAYSDDAVNDEEFSVYVGYEFGGYEVALGYADSDVDGDLVVLTLGGSFGPVDVAAIIGDNDNETFYGVSGKFAVGAATDIIASYADNDDDAYDGAYGIGFIHDLGGGVSLRGGVGSDNDVTEADLGVNFNF